MPCPYHALVHREIETLDLSQDFVVISTIGRLDVGGRAVPDPIGPELIAPERPGTPRQSRDRTSRRTADQSSGMGLPDFACAVYRASQRPYRALFESVWGTQAFAVAWPADVEQVCAAPGPPPTNDTTPVHLSARDRGVAAATFDELAMSIASYETSAEVTSFSSKFDAVLAKKAQLTPQEEQGYALFRGKAQCNACHRDGGPGEDPLFTDFTASNLGVPANPSLPYYQEAQPDSYGYVANPAGLRTLTKGWAHF
jgi:cytochrome c peroxidase